MLENTRAGLASTTRLFPPKLNLALEGRDIIALGDIDVVRVEKTEGAVAVHLRSRNTPYVGVVIEILPLIARDLVAQAPRMLANIPENRRAPVPALIEPVVSVYENIGEVAFFQIAPAIENLDMYWSAIVTNKTVRGTVTTGQVEALARDIAAVLADFTPEDHGARMVDCRQMGSARKMTAEDGDLPVGAFVNLTPKK